MFFEFEKNILDQQYDLQFIYKEVVSALNFDYSKNELVANKISQFISKDHQNSLNFIYMKSIFFDSHLVIIDKRVSKNFFINNHLILGTFIEFYGFVPLLLNVSRQKSCFHRIYILHSWTTKLFIIFSKE